MAAKKKSASIPEEDRPISSGALQSPSRPPPDSGVIDFKDPKRNACGVSICPKCGSDGRYYSSSDLKIACVKCKHTEQGRFRPRAVAWN